MIRHLLAPKQDHISPILVSELGLDLDFSHWLLKFGAVYLNHKRTESDIEVKTGDYLRVHTNPRRFPVDNILWKNQIIHDAADFLIINKPPGIPTHATVDNLKENAAWQIAQALNTPVFVTHRLDVATTGLILYAKTKAFQKKFNTALMSGFVEKQYQAEVEGEFNQTGILSHFMEPGNRLPKKLSQEPQEGWQNCKLEVLQASPKILTSGKKTTLLNIRLITGRTHQIRSQMAFEGHPIIGDKLYGSQTEWITHEKINLTSMKLKFHINKDYSFNL